MSEDTVYGAFKIFHFPEALRAIADGSVAAPLHVRIKPINHCNHGCWYCAYRASPLQLGEDMDLKDRLPEAKMFELVDDLVAMKVRAVTFSGGGEPLLYRALPEVIERLGRGGVQVATLTNGINLKGRFADALAAHATWVRISTDGWDDASYARARGIPEGEFSRVIANMRAFADRGSACVLGVSFIVTRENAGHIRDACARFKDAGVRHVKLSAAVVANDGAENERYHEPILATVAAEIAQAEALEDDRFRVVNHYHARAERFDKDYTICPFAHLLTVIGADGNIYACQDKAYTQGGLLGSIRERSFREAWHAPETRARLAAIEPRRDCRHHCVAHAKNVAILEYLAYDRGHVAFV